MRFGSLLCAALALGAASAPAQADGYPPFYGYSGYFGGPRTYFTPDTDVRSASTISEGLPGYGTRTYYQGGPFFHIQPARTRPASSSRPHRRRAVLRARG